jgi:hypothetical protein
MINNGDTYTQDFVVPFLLARVSLEIFMMSCDRCEENVFFEQWCVVCPLLKFAYTNIGMGGF